MLVSPCLFSKAVNGRACMGAVDRLVVQLVMLIAGNRTTLNSQINIHHVKKGSRPAAAGRTL